ncbi:MAG TPA: ABC transporter permease [Steroidobacteraceae bacterium]|nr:ABC transporter permease [Steroidobacteraceae bacterium]
MSWISLTWANLTRRKLRLVFTLLSIILAFLMFGMLDALRTSLSESVNLTGADRLISLSKVSIIDSYPLSHYEKTRAVDGVDSVVHLNWFGGVYKDGTMQIPVFPMNVEQFFEVYPEVKITPDEFATWKSDRQGMVIGTVLAERYGWKKGDRIPIKSSIFRKANGGDTWEFNIVAVYSVENSAGWDNQSAMFHYDYYNESLQFGRNEIGWMTVKVKDPDQSEAVAKRVDALFANSSDETKTGTEKAFTKQFMEQIGNIGKILVSVVFAVFFTMLLVTANTMAQSVRERTNEIGVLKTLGFSAGAVLRLIIGEALFLTIVGGLIGFGLAVLAVGGLQPTMKKYFPIFEIDSSTLVISLVLMVALGVITGLWPAVSAMRLKITDALRRG